MACACGGRARFAGRRPKTFITLLGPLTLERAYYHCDVCRTGVCPRDRTLGMHATSLSPGVLRLVGLAASDSSFAAASNLLWELAAVRVETKQVERCAEALGRAVAADERAVAETVPSPAPTMYLGLDGSGVPVRPTEVEGRGGKQPDGSAKTREVKLATVWTAEGRDTQGRPVRDRGSLSYNAAVESAASRGSRPPSPRCDPRSACPPPSAASKLALGRLIKKRQVASPARPRRESASTMCSGTDTACAIRSSAPRACVSRRASSRPDASSSAHGSSAPARAGRSPGPTPSSPCAAASSVAASRTSGSDVPQMPPDPHRTMMSLMEYRGIRYYAALLSAAQYHGAAHQRPQEFQVALARNRRPIVCGAVRAAFLARQRISAVPLQRFNTPRGTIRVSTPEATAVDLVGYERRAGGLHHVATLLFELAERIDPDRLVIAAQTAPVSWAQRLGYLLELVGAADRVMPLKEYVQRKARQSTALVPTVACRHTSCSGDWRLRINADVEPDT